MPENPPHQPEAIIVKFCRVCETLLPLDSFQKRSKQCKKCIYAKNKNYFTEYYCNNKADILEHSKQIYNVKTAHIEKHKRGRKPKPKEEKVEKVKQKPGRKPKVKPADVPPSSNAHLLLETFSDEDDIPTSDDSDGGNAQSPDTEEHREFLKTFAKHMMKYLAKLEVAK